MAGRRVGLFFETGEGHTKNVAERIESVLEGTGLEVLMERCRDVSPALVEEVDGVVVGGSIHAGRHNAKVVRFARQHQKALAAKPSAFFLVCLTARSDEPQHCQEVEGYLEDLQERSGWKPDKLQAFAGALLYTQYGFLKRKIMLSIVGKQGGDTDAGRDFVYTDWGAVEAFAREFAERLG